MIIRAGVVLMMSGDEEVTRLAPGDFFGEAGLLAGMAETHRLQALTRVSVYEVDQQAVEPLLQKRPELAEDLAAHLAHWDALRRTSGMPALHQVSRQVAMLQRIRSIFKVERAHVEL